MIAKLDLRRGCNSGPAYLGKELSRARDAAEDNRRGGRGRHGDLSAHPPNRYPRASEILDLQVVRGKVPRQDDCIDTLQRRQRFAQTARGQKVVVEIALAHQYDVEVASQRPMLKTVVENVQLRLEFPLGDPTRLIAISADNHRDAQPPRDQQWFVAEVGGVTIALNH